MLSEGTPAPQFTLPGVVDGEQRQVELAEHIGDNVVILAFYPADFNPACNEESSDLDALDLFTMQKDVTILGIGPDSVYSHQAFAEQYDLNIPLLADTDGDVAAKYDVEMVDDIGQYLLERAVVVIDHGGDVQYVWHTEDMMELAPVENIKEAIAEAGSDDIVFARYRVGYAHYMEGLRAFTAAVNEFGSSEWMMAQTDFQRARKELEEAADEFDTAVRFVDNEDLEPIYEGANTKTNALWQAADWLTRAASAYSSGNGKEGQALREDAEQPLETIREYQNPPDPDGEWPPEIDSLEKDDPSGSSILPTGPEPEDASLSVDIDEQMDEIAAQEAAEAEESAEDEDEDEDQDEIGEDDLAEIQAELEANNPDTEPSAEEVTEESTALVESPPGAQEQSEQTDGEDESERRETTAGKTLELAEPEVEPDSGDESTNGQSKQSGDEEATGDDRNEAPVVDGTLELTDPGDDEGSDADE